MANLSSKVQGVSQAAMPVITPPVAWTPTGSLTSNVTYTGKKWRIGNRGHYEVVVAFGGVNTEGALSINMPAGETIDTTAMPGGGVAQRVGFTTISDATGSNYVGLTTYLSTTSVLAAIQEISGSDIRQNSVATSPVRPSGLTAFASGDFIIVRWDVPIAGWESGTLQTANTYQVEYAYNTDLTTGSSATSATTAYGTEGAQTQVYAPTGNSSIVKTVRFRSPIQVTDQIVLEFKYNNRVWLPVENTPYGFLRNDAGTTSYGVLCAGSADPNEVDVAFYSQGFVGSGWDTSSRWRVKKVSGGIQGFGNATTTTPGLVTLAQLTPMTAPSSVTLTMNPSFTSITATLARRGNMARVTGKGTYASGTGAIAVSLPTGYSVDTTVHPADTLVGKADILRGGVSQPAYTGSAIVRSSSTISFRGNAGTGAGTADWQYNAPMTMAAGDIVHFDFEIAIAEWAGSLPGLVSDAQVEYASTSGTWDADSSTTTLGSGGALMGGTLTATRVKTVTWSTAAQAGDEIVVEGSKDAVQWFPINGSRIGSGPDYVIPSFDSAGTALAGVFVESGASSTSTKVLFGRYMNLANDDSPAINWPSSAAYWRVKKVKSSISALVDNATATSYGLVKGGNVPGVAVGTTIASANVGRLVEASGSTSTKNVDQQLATTTIPAGNWLVYCMVAGDTTAGTASATDYVACRFTTTSSPTTSGGTFADDKMQTQAGTAGRGAAMTMAIPLSLAADTVYYLHGLYVTSATTIVLNGRIRAVRVA